jgi:hypothetical protein
MKKPNTPKGNLKPTREGKPTTRRKGKFLSPATTKERTTKTRKRPGKPFNLKVLYPKQPELRGAIFAGTGVMEAFREYFLLKSGLFTLKGDEVSLVLPEPRKRRRPGGYCDNPNTLLNDLAATLAGFFTHEVKAKGVTSVKLEIEIAQSIGTILGCRLLFLEAGVPEKSFDATSSKLERWLKLVITSKIDRTARTPLNDLKVMLFHSYKRNSKFSDLLIFASIGRLMKSLGLEVGTEKKIANRLKTEIHELKRKSASDLSWSALYLRTFYNHPLTHRSIPLH